MGGYENNKFMSQKDPRPELVQQLAKAREKFLQPKFDNEYSSCTTLLVFFHRNKYLTESQAEFARKLIKIANGVRIQ